MQSSANYDLYTHWCTVIYQVIFGFLLSYIIHFPKYWWTLAPVVTGLFSVPCVFTESSKMVLLNCVKYCVPPGLEQTTELLKTQPWIIVNLM